MTVAGSERGGIVPGMHRDGLAHFAGMEAGFRAIGGLFGCALLPQKRSWLAPIARKHDFRERTAFPAFGRIAISVDVADGDGGADFEVLRDVEFGPGARGIEPTHSVDLETQRHSLEAELAEGCSGVVKAESIGLAAVGEGLFPEGNRQCAGVLRPCLVFLHQEAKQAIELGLLGAGCDDEPPGFLAKAGSGPAGGLKQSFQLPGLDIFAVESAGAPAAANQLVQLMVFMHAVFWMHFYEERSR